ncbi:SusC/RagA family TonB-linked outer membrane protein [Flammeovirga kamogawensis]|uniref:TonB-dependent receptor n=1 Tax=Flammeovirga kamogawensis TaxID=373891 RepID=A0ABX8GRU0_9BACT|nr:TonB-dependent receptor [Flammeovirga kamogawensis]MBB6462762.1 TonB-linked SusC/RagA family outer membrane protein [Flammeovirga kamogawensis]QWG06008.1 TonB-dependent receptor [Flammeovirga kamogawensis]TRX67838.1 TonB-dependent receptor [Flammeovirga kamogawensis]
MNKRLLSLIVLTFALIVSAFAQERTVSGIVSEAGQPLPGVTVVVKGTTLGTITDLNGKFSVSVSEDASLIFSFVGYTTQELKVGQRTTFNVTLEQDAEQLEEVTVMGYAKKDMASSTPEIENVTDIVTPNVANSLQGKAAGVNINASSGQPGSKSNIVIRGVGSVNASSDPLYVIDGVIQTSSDIIEANQQGERDPLANLNPEDIKDIKILKDAAATALYGARAANGVILVTTKGGSQGKTQITLSTKQGVSSVYKGNSKRMNGDQYVDARSRSLANSYGGDPADYIKDVNGVTTDDAGNHSYSNTDWGDHSFRQGKTSSYEVSMRGGDEKTKFMVSGGYYNQEGILVGSDFERYSARFNIDHKFNDKLDIQFIGNASYIDQLDASSGNLFSSPLLGTYMSAPTVNPFNEDGSPRDWLDDNPIAANFVHDVDLNPRRTKSTTGQLIGKLNYRITDWLTFRQTNAVNVEDVKYGYYTSSLSYDGRSSGGSKSNSWGVSSTLTNTSILSFDKTFNNVHNVSAIAGFEYQSNKVTGISAYGEGMPSSLQNLDNAAKPVSMGGYETEYRFMSFLGQAQYNYDGKYYATASYRRDGSSKFSANNKWGDFYSASASWYISREDFLNGNTILTDAKLRSSYGVTGNAEIDNFEARGLYAYSSYNNASAAYFKQLSNPDLTWEKRKKFNVGADVTFIDRITLNVDYYIEDSDDLLLNQQLSGTTGFASARRNIGAMRNSGWEFQLNTQNIRGEFTWNTNFNISLNKNEVTRLDNDQDIQINTMQVARVGSAMRTFFLREWAGADPTTGKPSWFANDGEDHTGKAGYFMKDGKWATTSYGAAERTEHGNPYPTAVGGMTNNFAYKGFDFSFFLTYSVGGKIYNSTRRYTDTDAIYPYNMLESAYTANRWEKEGDISDNPGWGMAGGQQHSTRFLEDGGYLALRNVTLGYTLPSNVVKKAKLSNVRIYASAQNLWILSDYKGFTPTTVDPTGINFFEYPEGKVFTGGLTVSF